MLQNAMPGEALLSNGVASAEDLKAASQNAPPNKMLQDMAEKLEKSEAGRKKLRQAIAMLKEKVEANEKVLQVNEILRQECEKERLRAEAERNSTEEEKKLRQQVEKEGSSTKEQLIRVLQRLDAVERGCKSDRNEIERMRKEMKEAISGLSGAVRSIEAAHSSFQVLEKSLLGKVSNAVSASIKSTSLAESAISDANGALGTAVAAEKLSQTLVSRVAVLQKQGSSLDQRVNLLQQEIRMRQLEPLDNELKTLRNRTGKGIPVATDKPSGRGMVLSKNQQQGGGSSPKVIIAEVARSEVNIVKPDRDSVFARGSLSQNTGNGSNVSGISDVETLPGLLVKDVPLRSISNAPVGGKATDVNSIPDSSRGNIVREALEAAKEKRKLRTISSSKVVLLPSKPSSQRSTLETLTSNATHASKECSFELDEVRGRLHDSGNGSMPALGQNEKNHDSHRCVPVLQRAASNHGSKADDLEGRLVANGRKGEKLPLALLNDITKLLNKEKKSQTKVEKKLAALQRVLSEESQVTTQGLVDTSVETNRKRKRREILKDGSKKKRASVFVTSKENHSVSRAGDRVTGKVSRGAVQVEASKWKSKKFSSGSDSTALDQSPVNSSPHSGPRGSGNDVFEAAGKCLKNSEDLDSHRCPDVGIGLEPATPANIAYDSFTAPAPEVTAPSEGIDMEGEAVAGYGLNEGWESDSETSENEFGEDWWTAKRVLLSPSLPEVEAPALLLKEPDSNYPSPWPAASDMNLEDIALFLDVLPPIDQEVCNKYRTEATFTNIADLKFVTEDIYIKSGEAALSKEHIIDQQPAFSLEILSDLHTCSKSPADNNFVQSFENGTKPFDEFGDCVEDEMFSRVKYSRNNQKNSLNGKLSMSSNCVSCGSPPQSSHLLPQDVNAISLGKSECLDDRLTVDAGASRDEALGEAQGAMKEEKLDAERCADMEDLENLSPYLELLVVASAESGWNSTASPVRQGPLRTTTDVSDKRMAVFRRIRTILHGALKKSNHTNHEGIGFSVAVAGDIVSFFRSSTLSKLDLICIFTASLVDSHASWVNEKTASYFCSERTYLQLLVDILKQVFVTEVFQDILPKDRALLHFAVQLQKFMIQGSIQPGDCQLILQQVSAEGRPMEPFFHFTPPSSKLKRIRTLISGGKLLAVFCENIGKLGFLRNSVYLVLRFSDLDSECLLAIISSFACVGCKNLFSVDNDDIVGRAVQVIISELINDAKVGRQTTGCLAKTKEVTECDMNLQQSPFKVAEERPDFTEFPQNLKVLQEVIGEEYGLTFEGFVPRLVELFHGVITTSLDSQLIDNRHLFQKSLRMIICNQVEPKSLMAATVPDGSEKGFETCTTTDVDCSVSSVSALRIEEKEDGESLVGDYCWRFVKATSSIQPRNQSERDANLLAEWEQRFYDITNAVELVANHLGWEWTYNDFIVEHLWKLVSPGAPAITVACVAHMFGLLGRLGREVDSTELPGVDELRKSLLVVLNADQTKGSRHSFPFRAQVAAAQSLLVLSSLNRKDESFPSNDPDRVFSNSSELHAKSVKCLWNWVKAVKLEIEEIVPLSVRSALLSIHKSNMATIF